MRIPLLSVGLSLAGTPLLEMRNLACERDEHFLFAGLNASLFAGQITQVLGPNGSGKTTLLRILAGVSQDFHGDILWSGKSIASSRWDYANDVVYVGHLPGIKRSLTPLENLRWYAAAQGVEDDKVLEAALNSVKLSGYEDTPCYRLSAGQLRRVALARLEFSRAGIWILDEPFTALDKSGVKHLEARLAAHAESGGLVIVTSHQDINIATLNTLDLQDFPADSFVKPQDVAYV